MIKISSSVAIWLSWGTITLSVAMALGCSGDNAVSGQPDAGGASSSSGSVSDDSGQSGSSGSSSGSKGGSGSSSGDNAPPSTDDGSTNDSSPVVTNDASSSSPTGDGGDSTTPGLDAASPTDEGSAPIDAMPPPPGDGGPQYSPCPPKATPCKIMPLGDSITQGFRSTGLRGYRLELFQAAINDKKNITFVGSQTSTAATVGGVPFPTSHEGHGGFTIDGIQGPVAGWMTAAKPDIVTLMIGTNDVNNYYSYKTATATDLANAPTRLAKLIDTILAQDPHVVLFVAQITATRLDAENMLVQTYNSAIPALVKARADAGKHVSLVDMYTAFVNTPNFKTALMKDDLHPADAGYKVMGDVWYTAVKPLLP